MAENNSGAPKAKRKQRGPGKPWAPGQSGNPGGRPKVAAELKELARQHGPEAIQKLVDLMRAADKQEVQARAAEALLDRGYGKATQSIAGEYGEGPIEFVIRDLGK